MMSINKKTDLVNVSFIINQIKMWDAFTCTSLPNYSSERLYLPSPVSVFCKKKHRSSKFDVYIFLKSYHDSSRQNG